MYENGILDRHTMKAVIDAIKWMKTQASLEKRYKEKEKKELLNILKELAKEKIIFPSNRDPIDQLNHK